jgi:hypothetical protein
MGRFISRDPKQYIDGMSQYSAYFVPNFLDPTGMKEICCKKWEKRSDSYDKTPVNGIGNPHVARCIVDYLKKNHPDLYKDLKDGNLEGLSGVPGFDAANTIATVGSAAGGIKAVGDYQASTGGGGQRPVGTPNAAQNAGNRIGAGATRVAAVYSWGEKVAMLMKVVDAGAYCRQEKCVDEKPFDCETKSFLWWSWECCKCPSGYSEAEVDADGWRDPPS